MDKIRFLIFSLLWMVVLPIVPIFYYEFLSVVEIVMIILAEIGLLIAAVYLVIKIRQDQKIL